jgi:2-phosphoglycerate kinase
MNVLKIVKKRNGNLVPFRQKNIEKSLSKTFLHLGEKEPHLVRILAGSVTDNLKKKHRVTVSVDEIRETIVAVLKENGLKEAAGIYDFVFLHIPKLGITTVVKRDGKHMTFYAHKIFKGVVKSLNQIRIEDPKKAELLTREIVMNLETEARSGIVTTEQIKETVEQILKKNKLAEAANAYLLHRYQ